MKAVIYLKHTHVCIRPHTHTQNLESGLDDDTHTLIHSCIIQVEKPCCSRNGDSDLSPGERRGGNFLFSSSSSLSWFSCSHLSGVLCVGISLHRDGLPFPTLYCPSLIWPALNQSLLSFKPNSGALPMKTRGRQWKWGKLTCEKSRGKKGTT